MLINVSIYPSISKYILTCYFTGFQGITISMHNVVLCRVQISNNGVYWYRWYYMEGYLTSFSHFYKLIPVVASPHPRHK